MPPTSYGALLRKNRNFRLLWLGQIVSQLGDWFNFVTAQALLLRLTGEATPLAFLWIAQSLPLFVLGPVAGVVVDRFPRKTVMIAADLARAVVALGFLAIHNTATAVLAYPLFAALSFFSVFFEPARTASIPNLTTRDELVTANALSSATWSIMLTSGSLAGGVAVHFLGYHAAFLLNAASFLASALFISGLRMPGGSLDAPRRSGFGEVRAGFRYVRGHPEIAALLTAKMGWGLTGGVQLLIPVFGQRIFPLGTDRSGALSFGLLLAISGVGTALGPIFGRRIVRSDPGKMRWAIAVAFLIGGVFYFMLGGAHSFAEAGGALFLARFGGSIIWVFSTVLLQMTARDEYRGRVFAAEASLFTLTMMISNLGVGRAIDAYGASAFQMARAIGAISLLGGAAWIVGLLRAGSAGKAEPGAEPNAVTRDRPQAEGTGGERT